MDNKKLYISDDKSGLQRKVNTNDLSWKNSRKGDEDLIIEDNTVYEIDRECYERLKKQRYAKSRKNDIGRWNIKRK